MLITIRSGDRYAVAPTDDGADVCDIKDCYAPIGHFRSELQARVEADRLSAGQRLNVVTDLDDRRRARRQRFD